MSSAQYKFDFMNLSPQKKRNHLRIVKRGNICAWRGTYSNRCKQTQRLTSDLLMCLYGNGRLYAAPDLGLNLPKCAYALSHCHVSG